MTTKAKPKALTSERHVTRMRVLRERIDSVDEVVQDIRQFASVMLSDHDRPTVTDEVDQTVALARKNDIYRELDRLGRL